MATIYTSTKTALPLSSHSTAQFSDGHLIAVGYDGTNLVYSLSTDGGSTWSATTAITAVTLTSVSQIHFDLCQNGDTLYGVLLNGNSGGPSLVPFKLAYSGGSVTVTTGTATGNIAGVTNSSSNPNAGLSYAAVTWDATNSLFHAAVQSTGATNSGPQLYAFTTALALSYSKTGQVSTGIATSYSIAVVAVSGTLYIYADGKVASLSAGTSSYGALSSITTVRSAITSGHGLLGSLDVTQSPNQPVFVEADGTDIAAITYNGTTWSVTTVTANGYYGCTIQCGAGTDMYVSTCTGGGTTYYYKRSAGSWGSAQTVSTTGDRSGCPASVCTSGTFLLDYITNSSTNLLSFPIALPATGGGALVGQGVVSETSTLLLTPATEQANATLAQSATLITGPQPLTANATLTATALILAPAVEQGNSVLRGPVPGGGTLAANAALAVSALVLAPGSLPASAVLTDTALLITTGANEQANATLSSAAQLRQAPDALAGNATLGFVPPTGGALSGNAGLVLSSAILLSPVSLAASAVTTGTVILETGASTQATSTLVASPAQVRQPAVPLAASSIFEVVPPGSATLVATSALSVAAQVLAAAPSALPANAALLPVVRLVTSATEQSSSILGALPQVLVPPVTLAGGSGVSASAQVIASSPLQANATLSPGPQLLTAATLVATSAVLVPSPQQVSTSTVTTQANSGLSERATLVGPPVVFSGSGGLTASAILLTPPASLVATAVLAPAPQLLTSALLVAASLSAVIAPQRLVSSASLQAGSALVCGAVVSSAGVEGAASGQLVLASGVVGSAGLALSGGAGVSANARVLAAAPASLSAQSAQQMGAAQVSSPTSTLAAQSALSTGEALLFAPAPVSASSSVIATSSLRSSAHLVGQGVLGGGYYGQASLADGAVASLTLSDGVVGNLSLSDASLGALVLGDT